LTYLVPFISRTYTSLRYTAYVGNEQVYIPSRIHFLGRPDLRSKVTDESLVRYCVLSRSLSGFERQSAVRHLLRHLNPWVAPFVIIAMGDYIVEILDDIADAWPTIDRAALRQCARENGPLVALTRDRIQSYWNEWYRVIPRAEYSGFKLSRAIDDMLSD
jgi:hypothetical protein